MKKFSLYSIIPLKVSFRTCAVFFPVTTPFVLVTEANQQISGSLQKLLLITAGFIPPIAGGDAT